MNQKPGGEPFGRLFFMALIGVLVILIVTHQAPHSKADIAKHPGWAVGYFDKFTYSHKTGYAQYRFQWKWKSYYSFAHKDWVIDLGSARKTTCYPVVFDTTDIDNSEVIIRGGQLDDLHLTVPDSIAQQVAKATNMLRDTTNRN